MWRKLVICVLSAAVVGTGLTGCGQKEKTAEAVAASWTWEKPIQIICPWGAGGGSDLTARQFAAALEKETGTPVQVKNIPGDNGLDGIRCFANLPADGYTYLLGTQSPLVAQISKATDFDVFGTLHPLCQLVHDTNLFVTASGSPYGNYQELLDNLAANPGTVKCGVMSTTGLDEACVIAAFGDGIQLVDYNDGEILNRDVVNGTVQLACVGPAEISELVKSGTVKGILSCTSEKMTIDGFQDIDAAGEVGIDCDYGPARGLFYIEGTPPEAVAAMELVSQKAVESESFQQWASEQGLDQREGWKNREDYTKDWDFVYKKIVELFDKK